MGNFVGKAMEDSMHRNQQFMTEINRFVVGPQPRVRPKRGNLAIVVVVDDVVIVLVATLGLSS